jgi:hypothetical protein
VGTKPSRTATISITWSTEDCTILTETIVMITA